MGIWDIVSYTSNRLKTLAPDSSTLKRATHATYHYTSSAIAKIIPASLRFDPIQKLSQYRPDDETIDQIGRFSTAFAMNAGKYAVSEGIKQIPGVTVVCKLVSDTRREVEKEVSKDKVKSTSSQPENYIKQSEIRSEKEDEVEVEPEKAKVARSRM